MSIDHITAAYSLGIRVAEHVHGINRKGDDASNDAFFDTLKAVVNGDLTLLDTPEEQFANFQHHRHY